MSYLLPIPIEIPTPLLKIEISFERATKKKEASSFGDWKMGDDSGSLSCRKAKSKAKGKSAPSAAATQFEHIPIK